MAEIRIEGRSVGLAGYETYFDHLYLVLVDDGGDEYVIRGGPFLDIPPFGAITIELGEPIATSEDFRPIADRDDRGSIVLDLTGRDALAVWETLLNHANQIALAELDYDLIPFQNSNSVVASLLHVVGLDISDWLPDTLGITSFPGSGNILDSFAFQLTGSISEDPYHNDTLVGGSSGDMIVGGHGADTLIGGADDDTLSAEINFASGGSTWRDVTEREADYLYGGDGFDTYHVGVYLQDGALGDALEILNDDLSFNKDVYNYIDVVNDADGHGEIRYSFLAELSVDGDDLYSENGYVGVWDDVEYYTEIWQHYENIRFLPV